MRILILTSMYPEPGKPGSGVFVRARARILKGLGHSVFVVKASYSRSKGFGLSPLSVDGDGISRCRASGFRMPLVGSRFMPLSQLRRLAVSSKVELIHVHGGDLAVFGLSLAKRSGLPCAVTYHGSDIHTRPWVETGYRKGLLRAFEEADLSIFVSNYLLEEAKRLGFAGGNSRVITNGIDTSVFHMDALSPRKAIGFVGHLSEHKRAYLLPEIFARLAKHDPNLAFIVIGDGPLREKLQRGFSSAGLAERVMMTGEIVQEEVARLMGGMKVLVLPSLKESWGCVAKEAQASGAMVVGSANGGIPESIGIGGVCVEDGEGLVDRYCRAIVALLEHPLDPETLQAACEGHDWIDVVSREAAELGKIVRRPQQGPQGEE